MLPVRLLRKMKIHKFDIYPVFGPKIAFLVQNLGGIRPDQNRYYFCLCLSMEALH